MAQVEAKISWKSHPQAVFVYDNAVSHSHCIVNFLSIPELGECLSVELWNSLIFKGKISVYLFKQPVVISYRHILLAS